ncbi:MAG: hypothetical protein QGI68_06825 [Pseudomonadales bacterium]|nr:hypothetical protein [Pseudomonadales bacterium]MDP7360363.1 hypothetical protein [Pseudomonadales bacterium]MDP7595268.1 hypothetical protein [Pseudomonadales bacterium]
MKHCLFVLTVLLTAGTSQADDKSSPPCLSDRNFSAFDFWVGEWTVTDRSSGRVAGTNRIMKVQGGCALSEDWNGKSGGTGMSVNYYNPVTGKWRQVWVAAGNYAIDIEGGLIKGSMVLEGWIYDYRSGEKSPFKGTWTPNEDGSVRQYFQQYNSESKAWDGWFDGLYVKKS